MASFKSVGRVSASGACVVGGLVPYNHYGKAWETVHAVKMIVTLALYRRPHIAISLF